MLATKRSIKMFQRRTIKDLMFLHRVINQWDREFLPTHIIRDNRKKKYPTVWREREEIRLQTKLEKFGYE